MLAADMARAIKDALKWLTKGNHYNNKTDVIRNNNTIAS
jgi:hypothetical protein